MRARGWPIADAEGVKSPVMGGHPAFEVGEVPFGGRGKSTPGDLGEGDQAREGLVVHAPGVLHDLGPQVGLGAEDVPRLLGTQLRWNRLETKDILKGADVPDGDGFVGTAVLTVVQVHLLLGAHDDVVAPARGRDAARVAAPGGDGGPRCEAALQDLVPADEPAPARGQPGVEVPDEPRLEPVLVADTEFLDAGLRGGRLPPLLLGALVAADVNELPGNRSRTSSKTPS